MSNSSKMSRSARISPDRFGVGAAAIALVMIIMTTSYIFSYATIADAAVWSGVPEWAGWVRFLAPIFIDGAILTYTVSFAIYRWRAEAGNARIARRWLWVFTMISVFVNGAHAASHWVWDFTRYEAWFGVLIAVSAPLAALVSAEEVVRLAFQRVSAAAVDPVDAEMTVAVGMAVATEPESGLVEQGAATLSQVERPDLVDESLAFDRAQQPVAPREEGRVTVQAGIDGRFALPPVELAFSEPEPGAMVYADFQEEPYVVVSDGYPVG